jgi:hypothetical protein
LRVWLDGQRATGVTNGTFHLSCARAKVRSWPPRPKPNITVCNATCRKTNATAKSTAVRARRKLIFACAAMGFTTVRLAGRRAGTEFRTRVRKVQSVRERSRETPPDCSPRRKPWISGHEKAESLSGERSGRPKQKASRFYRPFSIAHSGAVSINHADPRLTPWATFWRRFAASVMSAFCKASR